MEPGHDFAGMVYQSLGIQPDLGLLSSLAHDADQSGPDGGREPAVLANSLFQFQNATENP